MSETPRLGLPLIAAGQSQKDVTHNEAVLALDRLVALAVASRNLAVPPPAPAIGVCYIVPAGAAAAWGHPAGSLVYWQGADWLALTPRDGQIAAVVDETILLTYLGSWRSNLPVAGLAIGGRTVLAASPVAITSPAGGTTVDNEARAAVVALVAALRQQGIVA